MTRKEMLRNLENVYELYKDRPVHTFEINIASMIRDVISFIKENTIEIEPKHEKRLEEDGCQLYYVCSSSKNKKDGNIYECPNCLGEVHINYVYCPFCGIRFASSDGNISNAKHYSAYEGITYAWNRKTESEE